MGGGQGVLPGTSVLNDFIGNKAKIQKANAVANCISLPANLALHLEYTIYALRRSIKSLFIPDCILSI